MRLEKVKRIFLHLGVCTFSWGLPVALPLTWGGETAPFSASSLENRANPNVRFAELERYRRQLLEYPSDREKRYEECRRQLERCREFHREFPDFKTGVFNYNLIFGQLLSDDFSAFSKVLREKYKELCREARREIAAEMKRLRYPFDLADGIHDLKELENFRNVVIRVNLSNAYFCDESGWLEGRLADYRRFHLEAIKYLQKKPLRRSLT